LLDILLSDLVWREKPFTDGFFHLKPQKSSYKKESPTMKKSHPHTLIEKKKAKATYHLAHRL